jgi:hypothetical protein
MPKAIENAVVQVFHNTMASWGKNGLFAVSCVRTFKYF